ESARTSLTQVRRHESFRRPEELVERRRRDLDFATSAFSNALERHRRRQGDRLARVRDQLRQLEPAAQLRRQRTTLDTLSRRLDGVRQKLVDSVRHRLTREQARLAANTPSRQIAARRSQLQAAQRTLETLSPLAVLARGYSITTTTDGRVVQRQSDAPPGTTIETRLADGTVKSRVEPED
ncbi:MAG: exodeoxyribonuclease VII large subunit, partial [Planctomycetota bacterium]